MTVYYTVHGKDDYPKWDSGRSTGSIADDFGLEDRLGFRPRWCSGLYEDSLAESWFSIWAASPLYVELISFIETNKAVPIDALAWTQVRQQYMGLPDGQPGWLDEFERIFDVDGVPRYRLEYLVPDSPETTRSLPAELLTHRLDTDAASIISKLSGQNEKGSDALLRCFKHIASESKNLALNMGFGWPLSLENGYRCVVQGSGLPALLWMLGTKSSVDLCALDVVWTDFGSHSGCSYDRAQQIRQRWDEEPSNISDKDFNDLYRLFKDSLSEAAGRSSARMTNGIGRNDLCPCGSGKKCKKCHGTTHDIEWYTHRD